jgi:hypothetical protein
VAGDIRQVGKGLLAAREYEVDGVRRAFADSKLASNDSKRVLTGGKRASAGIQCELGECNNPSVKTSHRRF